jgi:hypothetical protein
LPSLRRVKCLHRFGLCSINHARRIYTRDTGSGQFAPKVRFAVDSPLEGAGFEPSVPRSRERTAARNQILRRSPRSHYLRSSISARVVRAILISADS